MALVPIVQPPVIKMLTTKKERRIRMKYEGKAVSKTTRILFPIVVSVIAGVVSPQSAVLIGFLMFGNLIRECGVLDSLSETAQKVLANLVTIHQKTTIGRLSAFCGAVSAGAGAGAGIAYLLDGSLEAISHTVVNAIATTGGMVCDGAKSSCATKIATAIEAAILGYHMHKAGKDLQPDDGIVGETPEHTIANVGRMAKFGMKETNEEIIKIMIGK